MRRHSCRRRWHLLLALALAVCPTTLGACAATPVVPAAAPAPLTVYCAEPATLDPQLAAEGDLCAVNVFDRLVETRETQGGTELVPSLVESFEVSDDGLAYNFKLREGVTFSNGSALTADDVAFTLERLAASPRMENRMLMAGVQGADALAQGKATSLSGFQVHDDYRFTITLEQPRPAFLSALGATAASILDRETTVDAGESFGSVPDKTVGTGPFAFDKWVRKTSIDLAACQGCWSGAPAVAAVRVVFLTDDQPYNDMFREGEIDVLDVCGEEMYTEYFSRGDLYRKSIIRHLGADSTCLVLNPAAGPLSDLRVRRALACALDRQTLLKAVIGGRGVLLDDICPSALSGGNARLAVPSFSQDEARELLVQAGLPSGFQLTLAYDRAAGHEVRDLMELVSWMWGEVGVRVTAKAMDEQAMAQAWTDGGIDCRCVTVTAGYDDQEACLRPVLGYDGEAMKQVAESSATVDKAARAAAFEHIARRYVERDGEVIPLFAHTHLLVVGERVRNLSQRWNGSAGFDLRGVRVVRGQG